MATTTQYRGNQAANQVNEDRGRSPFLWAGFPIEDILRDNNKGWFDGDEFLDSIDVAAGSEAAYGNYLGFASTGGSVANGTDVGGVRTLSSDGDNEGASFRRRSCPFKIARGQGKFVFECRVKFSTITDTKNGVFVGLMESASLTATVPIAAAGTLADQNLVGFHRLEGDGDQIDCVYKANGVTQVNVQTDALPTQYVLAADTWIKLGMIYDPDDYSLKFFANGVQIASYTVVSSAGTDFPNDVNLGFVIAILNATGTTPGDASIDWWYAGQLAA